MIPMFEVLHSWIGHGERSLQHIGFHQAVIRFFVDNQTTGLLRVTSHGGSIDVESRPGHGARFEIRLPAIAPEGTQEVAHDGAGG